MKNIIKMKDFGEEFENGVPLKLVIEKLCEVSSEKEFDFIGHIITNKNKVAETIGIINTEYSTLATDNKTIYPPDSDVRLIW